MFFLCPVFVWLQWLLVCEHEFLVNILIYFFDLFLLSVLDPFIQQAASGISDPSCVCSCILMTEVKSTFLAGRKYKIHGLNERSVIQRCVPPCYLNRCHCTSCCSATLPAWASFPAGTAAALCWWTHRPVHTDRAVTVTPQREEWWKTWLQKFPAYGNLSSPVLGSCCYVEVTEKLSVSRQIAKLRHPHLLMLLCTLPVPNALDGYSGSCTAVNQQDSVHPLFPVLRWKALLLSPDYTTIIYNPNS